MSEKEPEYDTRVFPLESGVFRSGLIMEVFLGYLKRNPFLAIGFFFNILFKGKQLTAEDFEKTKVDPRLIPKNKLVTNFIEHNSAVTRIILRTTLPDSLARKLIQHFDWSDKVIIQPVGKAEKLSEIYQEPEVEFFNKLYRAFRMDQWVKNFLIFIPIIITFKVKNLDLLGQTLIGFIAFCLASAAMYILSDLLDLHHNRKLKQQDDLFSTGELKLKYGFLLLPVLVLISLVLSVTLGWVFVCCLLAYYTMNLLYYFILHDHEIIDAITLGAIYFIRVLAGSFMVGLFPNFFLLTFFFFLFLSLGFLKRFDQVANKAKTHRKSIFGDGYYFDDKDLLMIMGITNGYLSILVFAFFIISPPILQSFGRNVFLWGGCVLCAYWIGRVWLLAFRKQLNEDPVVFAFKDRRTYFLALVFLTLTIAAQPLLR